MIPKKFCKRYVIGYLGDIMFLTFTRSILGEEMIQSGFLPLKRVRQWNVYSCGIADIFAQMKYIEPAISFSYEVLLRYAGLTPSKVRRYGARIDQMGKLCETVLTGYKTWVFTCRDFVDLAYVVNHERVPVGIEYQQIPDGIDQHELAIQRSKKLSLSDGHYSTIIWVDLRSRCVVVVDPSATYPKPRVFSFDLLEASWSDENSIPKWSTKTRTYNESDRKNEVDHRMAYFIAPEVDDSGNLITWPLTLGAFPSSEYLGRSWSGK